MFDTVTTDKATGLDAIRKIAERVGLSTEDVQTALDKLTGRVVPKVEEQAQQGTLPADITSNPQALPEPGTDEAETSGNSILGSIFGSKDKSREVAQQTADDTGISVDKIKKVLPQLATIAAGALLVRMVANKGSGGGLFNN
ncbi:MAG: DUF937 domain-containing protein [Sphingomicrobium sp.]